MVKVVRLDLQMDCMEEGTLWGAGGGEETKMTGTWGLSDCLDGGCIY